MEKGTYKTLQGKMLRYEGMTNSMNIYKFSSWKNNCPAHEYWDRLVVGNTMSATDKVADTLSNLKRLLNVRAVEINMRNNRFVDKIVSDRPEKEFDVMVPESKLDDVINHDDEMRKLSYRTVFHKSFYENIDKEFPYQELTLEQIGIPPFDVIQVSTDKGMFFVELAADAELYK